jgi:hypothetical protein
VDRSSSTDPPYPGAPTVRTTEPYTVYDKTYHLTDREVEILRRVVENEFHDGDPTSGTWTFVVCKTRDDKGVFRSLLDKGLVRKWDHDADRQLCEWTIEGREVYKQIVGIVRCPVCRTEHGSRIACPTCERRQQAKAVANRGGPLPGVDEATDEMMARRQLPGGGRPGPGRRPLGDQKRRAFSCTLPADAMELLDELVGMFAGSKSELIEYLIRKEARCEVRKD